MFRRMNIVYPVLLAALLGACGPQSVTPTPPPATAVPPATAGAGPTAAPPTTAAPTTVPAVSPVPVTLTPISAQLPAGFTPAGAGGFARFSPAPVQAEARVSAPPIAPDLSNVTLTVLLSPDQKARVAQNGFAVSPGRMKEFYELYERVRYDNIPAFVTTDSLLHVYHLLFDKTLRRAETDSFIPMLARLDWELLRTSLAQEQELAGTPWAEAARRNAAYFAVAVKTLDPEWPIPDTLRDLVEPDLAQIAAHNTIAPSAIFPGYSPGEDWSQYVPRGHYTRSEELKRYFVAMMWHGRMTFRATDETETQQAALLTLALRNTSVGDHPAQAVWSGIYEPTVFFVGRSDDLTPQEYGGALDTAYGQVNAARDLLDATRFATFRGEIEKLRPPQILGMVISLDEPDVEKATKGLRLMGQRFVPDAFVFRQLITRNVPRGLPKALDFFAALGSERALGHLADAGDTKLENYLTNMDKLRAQFRGYDEQVWTQNLYWSWIHSLRPLLEPRGEGYPQFMQTPAWLDKQLTTALGSWTELKRDTILYAKQVYAEGGGPVPPPEPERPKGYVEPEPLVYARVGALSRMTIDGLQSRGLLDENDQRALEAMERIAGQLKTIAEKELRAEPLSDEEYRFIRFYGAEIEALTFAAGDEATYGGPGGFPTGGEDLQAAVVADVATNPAAGVVLEQGVGRIFEIYVAVPVEGRLVLAKGGVFSHYEFVQPLSDRLTDETWREMLDAGKAPPLAPWTSSFMVEQTAEQPLTTTIAQFNTDLVYAFWFTELSGTTIGASWDIEKYLTGAELEDTRAYIGQLKGRGEFVGMKRLGLEFLSFDFPEANRAIVTTRERWSDELYRGAPFADEMTKTGVRKPYETTVTYTMERQGEQWKISKIVLRPEQPAWEQP